MRECSNVSSVQNCLKQVLVLTFHLNGLRYFFYNNKMYGTNVISTLHIYSGK
jgi:hypothetical protein